MDFESLMRFKALKQRYSSSNPQLLDHMIAADGGEKLGLKKVQFLVSPELHEGLRSVCDYLDMSQREFMETVTADAVKKAWEIIHEEHADPESLGYSVQEDDKC